MCGLAILRYNIPGVGRFVSADTIVPDAGIPQTFNRYAYAENRPLMYTDPSGHCIFGIDTAICIAVALGAGIGLIVDYSVQVHENIEKGMSFFEAVYKENVDWGSVTGATVSGGIGGGIAAPITSLAGPGSSLLTRLTVASVGGFIGGGVGGQTGTLAEASATEVASLFSGMGIDGQRFLDNAIAAGLLSTDEFVMDAVAGAFFAAAGEGLNNALSKSLSGLRPWQGSQPHVSMIKFEPVVGGGVQMKTIISGRAVTLTPEKTQTLLQALAQGTIDTATDLLEEWLNSEIDRWNEP